jgi:phage replication O-like protein O
MANPQKENGYTPIANEIMEALARTRIPGEAHQVLDVIIRKTYGFNKKEDGISISQFVEHTGLKPNHVCKALKTLRSMGIIPLKGNITHKGKAKYTTYCFIKDYQLWRPLPKRGTVPQKENNQFPSRGDTKDIITKETNNNISVQIPKKDIADKFVELYTRYLVEPGYARAVKELTPARIAKINARFHHKPEWDKWEMFFRDFIPQSKFLIGLVPPSQGHKQFRLDIDWLINESNFVKINEGKYHGQ